MINFCTNAYELFLKCREVRISQGANYCVVSTSIRSVYMYVLKYSWEKSLLKRCLLPRNTMSLIPFYETITIGDLTGYNNIVFFEDFIQLLTTTKHMDNPFLFLRFFREEVRERSLLNRSLSERGFMYDHGHEREYDLPLRLR